MLHLKLHTELTSTILDIRFLTLWEGQVIYLRTVCCWHPISIDPISCLSHGRTQIDYGHTIPIALNGSTMRLVTLPQIGVHQLGGKLVNLDSMFGYHQKPWSYYDSLCSNLKVWFSYIKRWLRSTHQDSKDVLTMLDRRHLPVYIWQLVVVLPF